MRYRKAIFLGALCVALVGIGGIGLFRWSRPAPVSLLKNARRIADIRTWKKWWWLDNHRLLVVEIVPQHPCHAFVLDSVSGKRLALPKLTRTLSTLGAQVGLWLSPDGQWLIAIPSNTWPAVQYLISVADGKVQSRYSVPGFRGWLPDSRGWIAGNPTSQSTDLLFHVHGGAGTPIRSFPLQQPPGFCAFLGFAPNGDYWFGQFDPTARTEVHIFEIDLRTARLRRTRDIPLPPAGLISEIMATRDRQWLAWQTRPEEPIEIVGDIWEHLGWYEKRQAVNTIWLSRTDGTGMKYLGETEVLYGPNDNSDLSVEWLPDSRHLSISQYGILYMLTPDMK